jgi:hypothetical protein
LSRLLCTFFVLVNTRFIGAIKKIFRSHYCPVQSVLAAWNHCSYGRFDDGENMLRSQQRRGALDALDYARPPGLVMLQILFSGKILRADQARASPR